MSSSNNFLIKKTDRHRPGFFSGLAPPLVKTEDFRQFFFLRTLTKYTLKTVDLFWIWSFGVGLKILGDRGSWDLFFQRITYKNWTKAIKNLKIHTNILNYIRIQKKNIYRPQTVKTKKIIYRPQNLWISGWAVIDICVNF